MKSKLPMSAAAQAIMEHDIEPRSVQVAGALTNPRTWGVYEIEPPASMRATRRFRMGNHPIRRKELEHEFGAVKRVAVFRSRSLAVELSNLLNAR